MLEAKAPNENPNCFEEDVRIPIIQSVISDEFWSSSSVCGGCCGV